MIEHLIRDLRVLLWWAIVLIIALVVVFVVLMTFQLVLSVWVPLALALIIAAILWAVNAPVDRDHAVVTPELNPDPDYQVPHGDDLQVRRLEEMIHGAQPRRRMTGRSLGRTLGRAAALRSAQAPALSVDLQQFIARASDPDAEDEPMPRIDRRTLRRYLTELAATEENRP